MQVHRRKPSRATHVLTRRRRGAMIILIALLLPVFIGMVAFLVDAAYMQLVRTQLRIATDAAARASGEALSRAQTLQDARDAAKALAAEHIVAGDPLLLDDADIVAGHVSRQENGKWTFAEGEEPINGLKVTGRRTKDSLSGDVKLFFAKIFSIYDFETSCSAVVVRLDRDVCLVVDRSGSMKLYVDDEGGGINSSDPRFSQPPGPLSRWCALEDAVAEFNSALATTVPIEHVALVSYASDGTWCDIWNNASELNQPLTTDLAAVNAAAQEIGDRVFNGMTSISDGIDRGVLALTDPATSRPFAAKTMVVMTDGYQTAGRPAIEAAVDAAAQGITVHTITFGDDANQADMQAVAAAAGGMHYHAVTTEGLNSVFREIALTLPVLLTE